MRVRLALILLLFCFTLPAFAQDKVIPEGLIVEPAKPKLSIDVRLDRGCFVPKHRATVHFWTDQDSYIYNINVKGRSSSRTAIGSGRFI